MVGSVYYPAIVRELFPGSRERHRITQAHGDKMRTASQVDVSRH
jgi:hypothetical protein